MHTIEAARLSNRMLAHSCKLATLLLVTKLLVSIGATSSDLSHPEPLIDFEEGEGEITSAAPAWRPPPTQPDSLSLFRDAVSNAEVEAHLEVESLLYDMSEQTGAQDFDRFLDMSAESMQNLLETQAKRAEAGESSSAGEVRSYSSQLMRQLVHMYVQVNQCKLEELSAGSEAIGRRSTQIEKQLETQLVHLNKYLAALYCASEPCTGAEPRRRSKKKEEEEKSWFTKALEMIGL